MDRGQFGGGLEGLAHLLFSLLNPRIGSSPLASRSGYGGPILPPQNSEVSGIFAEQSMKPRRTRTCRADDYGGRFDLFLENFGMACNERLGGKARHEISEDPFILDHSPGLAEACFVLEGIE